MTETPPDLDKLRSSLGGIEVACMKGDNLAVTLCTYFENPSQDRDGETGWTEDAIDGYEATLDAIHKHYAPLIAEAKQARELREALEKSKATMNIMANKAHEVGLEGSIEWDKVAGTADLYGCLRLVSAALAAERERCVKICDDNYNRWKNAEGFVGHTSAAKILAEAIRNLP